MSGNWRDLQEVCAADDRSTSFSYDECLEACPWNLGQTSANGYCVCAKNYAINKDRTGCTKKGSSECQRTVMMTDEDYSGETCTGNATCDPEKYKLGQDGTLCIPLGQEEGCRFFVVTELQELSCVKKCATDYYKDLGAKKCVRAQDTWSQPKTVLVLGNRYQYWQRRATSYAEFDLKIVGNEKKAAYFEMARLIVALRLRATGQTYPQYAPVVFFSAISLRACDFQLSAGTPLDSAILAIRLLVSPQLVGCHLFSSFQTDIKYKTAIRDNGNVATVKNCIIDLDGTLDDAFQKISGNVELPSNGQ